MLIIVKNYQFVIYNMIIKKDNNFKVDKNIKYNNKYKHNKINK